MRCDKRSSGLVINNKKEGVTLRKPFKYFVEELPSGGRVIYLDSGSVLTSEDIAMLQALYSRGIVSVLEHLKRLAKTGSGQFMRTFYVGYNHKSIGDCGTVTLFIEGASMLAAKAVEDWALYSGQECSTRYIDFKTQPYVNPFTNDPILGLVSEQWRELYRWALPRMTRSLKRRYPYAGGDRKKWRTAVEARAFDIIGSILPAGVTTNLSWHANLRQTADKLGYLSHHPLPEVRDIATAMERLLERACPNSFPVKKYFGSEEYRQWWMSESNYHGYDWPVELGTEKYEQVQLVYDGVDHERLARYREALLKRPSKTELPKLVGDSGTVRFEFLLDYRSYRDFQRMRSLIQAMPLLHPMYGFEQWYLDQMPRVIRAKVLEQLDHFTDLVEKWLPENRVSQELWQYITPMGYRVFVSASGDLPAWAYVVELRSGPTVHATLRRQIFGIAKHLRQLYGSLGLKLHVEEDVFDRFEIRRGSQVIMTASG